MDVGRIPEWDGMAGGRTMIEHDAAPGFLGHCQVCGSDDLRELIDLGSQPLCDALLTRDQLREPEPTFPLRLMQCKACSLAQLDYVVSGAKVYPPTYPYRAGISWPIVAAHKEMAADIVKRYGSGFCVDVGSNDGTLLAQLQSLGCEVLGFEPTDIARIAAAAGIPTVQEFFGEHSPRGRRADVITFTNVFAHMANLGDVMRGVCAMLTGPGVLIVENHYLLDILERNQFDSIYHEHIRTYTLRSLVELFGQYGLEVFDVERKPRYGGNIRVHVGRRGMRTVSPRVGELLRLEVETGLNTDNAWKAFRARVFDARDEFREYVRYRNVVACSAPGRASTLLNFYGVHQRDIPFTGEIDGSLKIGKYLPGCRIPVVSNTSIAKASADSVILLAWHYGTEIKARLRKEGVASRLVVPLPALAEI